MTTTCIVNGGCADVKHHNLYVLKAGLRGVDLFTSKYQRGLIGLKSGKSGSQVNNCNLCLSNHSSSLMALAAATCRWMDVQSCTDTDWWWMICCYQKQINFKASQKLKLIENYLSVHTLHTASEIYVKTIINHEMHLTRASIENAPLTKNNLPFEVNVWKAI